jgi:polysaccharide export outer membrane protein
MNLGNKQRHLGGIALAIGFLSAAGCAAQHPVVQSAATTPPVVQNDASSVADAAKPGQSVQTSGPALTVRDEKVLDSFQPPIDEEYTLGAGDEISLDFPTQPDLNVKTTVGPDGVITVRNSGPIHVAGLTREAAGTAVEQALAKNYKDASATVTIDKYSSNSVRVVGYVQHPGSYTFEGTPTLLDAIGKAGMISPQVTSNGVASNVGPGIPETCTIYRGNNTAVQVQLEKLLKDGSVLADMRLRRNDIVWVPAPQALFVSVMGQVAKPGTIPLTPESTLTSILAQAGCCSDNGGFNPTIQIVQPSTGKEFKVKYKEIMTVAGQKEFALHPGDFIFVPTSGLSKFGILLQKISPVATMVSLAAIAGVG